MLRTSVPATLGEICPFCAEHVRPGAILCRCCKAHKRRGRVRLLVLAVLLLFGIGAPLMTIALASTLLAHAPQALPTVLAAAAVNALPLLLAIVLWRPLTRPKWYRRAD